MPSEQPQPAGLRRPDTFHGFSQLPPELRLTIMELALEPHGHTAQICPLEGDVSANEPDPKNTSKVTLNFVLEREHEIYKMNDLNYLESFSTKKGIPGGINRGMWRACKESRELMVKKTKGPFEAYFNNHFIAYLLGFFPNTDMIHLIGVPPGLDAVVTKGASPSPMLMRRVDEETRSRSILLVNYDPF
ncbi:tetracycline resistance [Fusarium beomiforme]|uniref:Tetracycline resistance n=1 Tax=Fusarium beomiforme TaxID=44412 RepID=A0A9P5ANZ5_9HYPO|nr:tetracycline resistance [Fusarium beomiforme]